MYPKQKFLKMMFAFSTYHALCFLFFPNFFFKKTVYESVNRFHEH